MKDAKPASAASAPEGQVPPKGTFDHKTIGIYPDFADVGNAFLLLHKNGFTDAQISVLGREQPNWQQKVGNEWDNFKVTKAALGGAALGAVPGLVLITGIALTGGVGILAVGPMVGAMSALGLGTFGGTLMGIKSTTLEIKDAKPSVEQEVAEALSQGQWVVVVDTATEDDALRARTAMPNRRISRNEQSATPEAVAAVDEQIDLIKLGQVVEEAIELVAKESTQPPLEVMCKLEKIEAAALKKAANAAITKISDATDLDTTEITDIFKEYRVAGMDAIVSRLREQSHIRRSVF